MTVLAAASWVASVACSAGVSASCGTLPRTPCSSAMTLALLATAALPPLPAPTSPGDAGVGAASSHGVFAAAVRTLAVVDDVLAGAVLAGNLPPEVFELDPPQPATASA